MWINSGNDYTIGQEFLGYFQDIGNLKPHERILDVGCGNGRMAKAIKDVLSPEGEYCGFDIMEQNIVHCKGQIQATNFKFSHVDIYNNHYNPKGVIQAKNFEFPFGDNYFDFIILTSVFTHMLTADMENYFSEISRVLKVDKGRCFITFFILNKESEDLIKLGRGAFTFKFQIGESLTEKEDNPAAAVAYKEDFIRKCFKEQKLRIEDPIHYGGWCGRKPHLTYQDVIIAKKAN